MRRIKHTKRTKYLAIIHWNVFIQAIGAVISRRRAYAEIAAKALSLQPMGPPTASLAFLKSKYES